MNKIKTFLCGAVAVIATATAVYGGGLFNSAVKATAEDKQLYTIDFGEYTPKADDSVNIDVSYTHGAYLYTKRPTDGNIRLKFKTVSYTAELQTGDYNGLVRGVYSDIAYAYVPTNTNFWYVFGDGNNGAGNVSLYSEEEYTDVLDDVTAHAFTVKIGEENPIMNKWFWSAEGAVADTANAKSIAWDANNAERKITASLTDFSATDEDGYYLGVALSRTGNAKFNFTLKETMCGYAGRTVTIKYFGEGDAPVPCVYGENGKKLGIAVTELGNGAYSFVMPGENVKIRSMTETDKSEVYGTYYDSATGDMYVLGETSYKKAGGTETALTLKAYTDGTLMITANGETAEGYLSLGKITVGETVYKKLLSYKVAFIANGETVKSETLSSGDYKVTAPADPVKEGYVFVGWKNGRGEAFDENKIVTESAVYYADFAEEGGHVDPAKEKGGCKSSVAGSTLAVVAMVTAVFIIKTRKKKA